jgi:hypothetical protein
MSARRTRKGYLQVEREPEWLTIREFFSLLVWIDGRPLRDVIEPYRLALFERACDTRTWTGTRWKLLFNLILAGRGKKNWKSADLILAFLFALLGNDSPGGNECLLVASDEGQADEDLALAKKLIEVNPVLAERLVVREKAILRADGRGRGRILPGRDVAGEHGKSYRFLGIDEIHTQRNWDLLEALALDPTRADAQQWITSYASIYHKPGVPLHDLMAAGRRGDDPRMLFSWYGADYTTDPDFQTAPPEQRANPSMASWGDDGYIEQQRRRLPSHKFRRLHLNLPGQPEGSAYQAEPIMESIVRGRVRLAWEPGAVYTAFVDMSGGSSDDAYVAISRREPDGRLALVALLNQGPPPPFDPRKAVERFAALLAEYHVAHVWGDRYAGLTFLHDFARHGVAFSAAPYPTGDLYEHFEPLLNARDVILLDSAVLESQLLSLVWKGGKITHPIGEHDDAATAAVGSLVVAAGVAVTEPVTPETLHQEGATAFMRDFGLPMPWGGWDNFVEPDYVTDEPIGFGDGW